MVFILRYSSFVRGEDKVFLSSSSLFSTTLPPSKRNTSLSLNSLRLWKMITKSFFTVANSLYTFHCLSHFARHLDKQDKSISLNFHFGCSVHTRALSQDDVWLLFLIIALLFSIPSTTLKPSTLRPTYTGLKSLFSKQIGKTQQDYSEFATNTQIFE